MIMISRERSGLIFYTTLLFARHRTATAVHSTTTTNTPPRPPRRSISLFEALLFCFGSSLGEL